MALVITGPTASGKSALAYELANWFPVEVINLDSAQVYQGLDIGTAKPTLTIQNQVPHHLLDIREPTQPYTAFDFCRDARLAIEAITRRGRVPLLVGGTMLYLKALREGIAAMPPADSRIRDKILAEATKVGWSAVHDRLQTVDPIAAARIKPTDRQRLQRALEVHELTGETITQLHAKGQKGMANQLVEVAIVPEERSELHQKIAERFDDMLDRGFVDEVNSLRSRFELDAALPAMKAVGYRQVWQYLEGELDAAAMREKGIVATRQLAKRQFTWLRSFASVRSLLGPSVDQLLKIEEVANILNNA
jgi:tRNA dimethylallyltransferase